MGRAQHWRQILQTLSHIPFAPPANVWNVSDDRLYFHRSPPGGLVDDSDFSAAWRPLLSILPLEPLLLSSPRPATFLERPPSGDELPAEIGFRLAAIRETFEETGLLLARPAAAPQQTLVLPPAELERWRARVHRQPAELLRLARELAVVPDVWSLHEWSAWLTPVGVPGNRHDAAFFVASVPDRPEGCGDETETEHVEVRLARPDGVGMGAWLAVLSTGSMSVF